MTETNEKVEPKPIDLGEYKYGFHDDVTPVFSTGKGISEDVVRAMSAEKGEPEWMLEFRLKSLETFMLMITIRITSPAHWRVWCGMFRATGHRMRAIFRRYWRLTPMTAWAAYSRTPSLSATSAHR